MVFDDPAASRVRRAGLVTSLPVRSLDAADGNRWWGQAKVLSPGIASTDCSH